MKIELNEEAMVAVIYVCMAIVAILAMVYL